MVALFRLLCRLGALGALAALASACGLPPGPDEMAMRRALCVPGSTGLVFNEWLANPNGVDAGREWIELRNTSPTPVCIGRAVLEVQTAFSTQERVLQAPLCVPPDGLVLLGDGSHVSRARMRGVPVDVAYGAMELPNAAAQLQLRCQDTVLAAVAYGEASAPGEAVAPAPLAGHATARDGDGDGAGYCTAMGPRYDGRDQGSPGEPNPGCWLCSEGTQWRVVQPAPAGTALLGDVYTDPVGPDRDREWVQLRGPVRKAMDLQDLQLRVVVPGRAPRRYVLWADGCAPLHAGDDWQVPVCASPAGALPRFVGPTLPNTAARYELWQRDTLVDAADVAAPLGHAPVAAVRSPS